MGYRTTCSWKGRQLIGSAVEVQKTTLFVKEEI